MTRILFVCLGNICRSPMAEFIMKDLVDKRGLSDKFHIESAGTSDEEIWNGIGNPVYPPARDELRRHGITDVSGKQARQIRRSDYDKYDLIIGMEQRNIHTMLRIFGSDPEGKIKRLLDYSDRPRDISDPWYTRNFESAYNDIFEGCTSLLDNMFM
ncbi:MAG: low molecular weight phosphotyrosine protein phosphatase [Lachnospiraceae bacterium]|nr:low molecular weight phosphotyrosine protein phosphatase [Lachnospiraceae bacterium]